MKSSGSNYLNIDRRLSLTLALLIALILGGNGLVIFQFDRARLQTNRLTGVSQQLIAVLRLQESLQSFHQQLNELVRSKDAHRLLTEAEPLRTALLEETRQTKRALAYWPSEFRADPAFLTAMDEIETTLPSQLQDLTALAAAADWEAVRLRADTELQRMEIATSTLVKSLDRDLDRELPRAVANMRDVQRKILLTVPSTAICTVFIAAFFGWAMARRILELRLEERVSERTRIARELHDTLLQSFQGVLMKLSMVPCQIPDHPEVQETLETIVTQARQAVTEGRDAVQGLRSSRVDSQDLAGAIGTFAGELASGPSDENPPEFHLQVEGRARDLSPLVRDEVYRIACEALRNAFRHANARRINVEIDYREPRFGLIIRDNGKGIDEQILEDGGLIGHHGLTGMRERARLAGGKLTICSKPGFGTETEVTIPAALAYLTSPGASRSMITGRETS